jgi:hypothetical protein
MANRHPTGLSTWSQIRPSNGAKSEHRTQVVVEQFEDLEAESQNYALVIRPRYRSRLDRLDSYASDSI